MNKDLKMVRDLSTWRSETCTFQVEREGLERSRNSEGASKAERRRGGQRARVTYSLADFVFFSW